MRSPRRCCCRPASTGSMHAQRLFEDVVDGLAALISRHREPGTEVLRFPPVMSRRHLEKSGYLKSFPHLLGCVCCLGGSEADVRRPVERFEAGEDWTAALVAGRSRARRRPPAIRSIRSSRAAAKCRPKGFCSTSPATASAASRRSDLDRLQSFRMREYVCVGTPEQIHDFRERWMARAQELAEAAGPALAHRSGQRSVLRPRRQAHGDEPDRAGAEVRAARSGALRRSSRPPA